MFLLEHPFLFVTNVMILTAGVGILHAAFRRSKGASLGDTILFFVLIFPCLWLLMYCVFGLVPYFARLPWPQ